MKKLFSEKKLTLFRRNSPDSLSNADTIFEQAQQQTSEQKDPRRPQIDATKLEASDAERIRNGENVKTISKEKQDKLQKAKDLTDKMIRERHLDSTQEARKVYEKIQEAKENNEDPNGTDLDLLIQELEELPAKKAKEREDKQNKTEAKKQSYPENLDHPLLKEAKKPLLDLLEKNPHLTNNPDFWRGKLDEFVKNNPTPELVEKEVAKTIREKFKPRQKTYEGLEKVFKEQGLGEPKTNDFISKASHKERQQFLETAKDFSENVLNKINDLPYYSKKQVQELKQEIFNPKSLNFQEKFAQKATKTFKLEQEYFSRLKNDKIQVKGMSIRKVSDETIKNILEGDRFGSGYLDCSLEERAKRLEQWPSLLKNEASLLEGNKDTIGLLPLFEKYGKNEKELKLALKLFEKLSFQEKIQFIKDQEDLFKTESAQEEKEEEMLMRYAKANLDTAKNRKEISSDTHRAYLDYFENEEYLEHYSTQNGKKLSKTEALEAALDNLTSKKADYKSQNLAAYKEQRDDYKENLKKLGKISPDLKKSDLNKRQNDFDKLGMSDRTVMLTDLKDEISETQTTILKAKYGEESATEKPNKASSLESKYLLNLNGGELLNNVQKLLESPEKLSKFTINDLTLLINKVEYVNPKFEALNTCLSLLDRYRERKPESFYKSGSVLPRIKDRLMKQEETMYRQKLQESEELDEKAEAETAARVEEETTKDATLKKDLEKAQISGQILKAQKQTEDKYGTLDTETQGKKIADENFAGDKNVQDLAKDFYESGWNKADDGKEYLINKDGYAEEVDKFDLNATENLDSSDTYKLKEKLFNENQKIQDGEGIESFSVNIDGKEIKTADEGQKYFEKNQMAEIQNRLNQKVSQETEEQAQAQTLDNLGMKDDQKYEKPSMAKLNDRIAKMRQARKEALEKRTSEEAGAQVREKGDESFTSLG